ncbi:SDR family oxidoreductase [Saccharospirillum mangrovi]|uniref:SDR family oxidoreductase n=1 Tax=Saccharospirillum mangrovi TaxID=2161747 RepID=UPI000D342A86|nr:aldehyde reductase [Saccharospirillum mangrovi]
MSANPESLSVLVTGGSGFVASHAIAQLLQQGHRVTTTVRDLSKQSAVVEMMHQAGVTQTDALRFIEADLMDDHHWADACAGVDYVLHIASPIFLRLPKHEDEMILPAVEGTQRVLKAARDAGVKRVVMTSNFGAVGYSHKDPTQLITEADWTDPNEPGLSPYNKSKVMAERTAWEFMAREGGDMELSVVNPMGIFGPQLSPVMSSGLGLLKAVLDGSMKRLPNITLGIVDVRDVASLHLLAMTHPQAAGERFLALAGGVMTLRDIAELVREKLPHLAVNASRKTLPDWAVRLAALFNDNAKGLKPMLGINRLASNSKATTVLGWQPRTNEEAILSAAQSLEAFGLLT